MPGVPRRRSIVTVQSNSLSGSTLAPINLGRTLRNSGVTAVPTVVFDSSSALVDELPVDAYKKVLAELKIAENHKLSRRINEALS
jgi:hypothetical protein